MKCKIDGCGSESMYKAQQVCQKHYFRYMRNGSYEKKKIEMVGKTITPNGYVTLYAKGHPIAILAGRNRVFEHRVVYYDNVNSNPDKCEICQKDVDWSTLHIDHINCDKKDNRPDNLRCLCRGCNTKRGRNGYSYGTEIEFNGRRLTPFAWSKEPDVFVTGPTIRRRLLKGWSVFDALFKEKKTHKQ